MSDAVIIAIAGAVVAVSQAVQIIFINRAKKSADAAAAAAIANGEKADKAVERTDQLMTKTDEIHTATNGALSAIKQELALSRQENVNLTTAQVLAKENAAAAVDAALATTPPTTVTSNT